MMRYAIAVLTLVGIAVISVLAFSPASGQDRTEERLNALETRVAILETEVADTDDQSASADQPETSELYFSGTGSEVIEGIALDSSLLICSATHNGQSNFIVELFGPADEWDLMVNEIGNYSGESLVEVDSAGPFILAITADGAWELDCRQP